ncbi:MAG: histidinol-phosphate transaminase [Pyrinomonadaceae bacterium]
MTFDPQKLVRENIRRLKPYSSARSEFAEAAEVFLDANENAFGSPAGSDYNRYPDPLQLELKQSIAEINGISSSQIFVGNGSDEAIDLLFRIFCEPGHDDLILCPPTYGMYRVSAEINDVCIKEVPLTQDFQLDVPAILDAVSDRTKLIFLCSPNNPTGNLMSRRSIVEIAEEFEGIVVVDEAYIHFAGEPSMISEVAQLPNLVVLQTFSKAWGMAGLRVGLAFASEPIVNLMNGVKPPYNVSAIAQHAVLDAIASRSTIDEWIVSVLTQRTALADAISTFDFVQIVFPSDANFLLIKTINANSIYEHLIAEKIVVRNRSNVELCEGCLRITVGTIEENKQLLSALKKFEARGLSAK